MALPAIFFPVIRAAIETALKNGKTSPAGIAAEVEATMAADPAVKNQVNGEPWYQSRVALGSIVAALGVVLPPVLSLFGVDTSADKIVEFGTALVTLGGALFALYGRFASGLKPLFSPKG